MTTFCYFAFGFIVGVSVMLWVASNIYVMDEVREENIHYDEYVNQAQDTWWGRAIMRFYYWPAAIYLHKWEREWLDAK